MKYFNIIVLLLFGVFFSCKNNSEVPNDNKKLDSLMTVIDAKNKEIALNDYVTNEMASVLDSISKYENLLITNKEGKQTKASAMNNLKRFQEILALYKERITAIQDSLSKTKNANKSLLTIVEQLNGQLQAKESQIASLQKELQSGKKEIKGLKSELSNVIKSNNELTRENEQISKVADVQDKIINKGYFIVDTKANLKKKGILKGGGLLSKAIINTSNVNESNFVCIDIRDTKEITAVGKSPKILSQMPAGSYHWKGQRLFIDNPTSFWQVTKYLIIQVN